MHGATRHISGFVVRATSSYEVFIDFIFDFTHRKAMKYLIRSSDKKRMRIPGTIQQVAIYVHHRVSRDKVEEVRGRKRRKTKRGGVSNPNS